MTNRLLVRSGELKLLMLAMRATEIPGMPQLSITEDRDALPTPAERDALVQKKVLERAENGRYSVVDTAALMLRICVEAPAYIQGSWYRQGALKNSINISLRKEDIVLLEGDDQDMYQLLWIPALPLAAGGLIEFLQVPGAQSEQEMGTHPWPLENGEAWQDTLARFARRHLNSEPDEYGRVVTIGGDADSQADHYYIRSDGALYMAALSADQVRLSRPDAVSAVKRLSRWLAYTHREQLMEVQRND